MESVVNKFELFKAVISLITTAITYEDQLINQFDLVAYKYGILLLFSFHVCFEWSWVAIQGRIKAFCYVMAHKTLVKLV